MNSFQFVRALKKLDDNDNGHDDNDIQLMTSFHRYSRTRHKWLQTNFVRFENINACKTCCHIKILGLHRLPLALRQPNFWVILTTTYKMAQLFSSLVVEKKIGSEWLDQEECGAGVVTDPTRPESSKAASLRIHSF